MRRSPSTPPGRIPFTALPSWCWLREHPLAKSLATDETREAVEKYIFDSSMRSNVDRMQAKEKTGVFTGSYAINPLNGAKTPIWLSDYVLADYGTGAIMCVPLMTTETLSLPRSLACQLSQVIAKDGKEIENMTEAYTEASGTMINSGEWNGMESAVLKKEAPHMIEEKGLWTQAGQLQAERLGILTSALLGRAHSDYPLS